MTALNQLSALQAQKEVVANDNFEAVNIAGDFAKNPQTTGGLTWGYYGGTIQNNGSFTVVANGTITLAAGSTNYVEMTVSGIVSSNTTGFTPGRIPLYQIGTTTLAISYATDMRTIWRPFGYFSKALSDANYTLTAGESRNDMLKFTGTLTAARTITVPAVPGKMVVNNATTGGFALDISCGGASAAVASGTVKQVVSDGVDCFVL